jgi:hypothetical protein
MFEEPGGIMPSNRRGHAKGCQQCGKNAKGQPELPFSWVVRP